MIFQGRGPCLAGECCKKTKKIVTKKRLGRNKYLRKTVIK